MTDKTQVGFGRRYAPDRRDKRYAMSPIPVAKNITYRHWWSPGVLDQGQTSKCVGYGSKKYLTTGPIVNHLFTPDQLYKGAQQNDEWPGEDYEGSSVRGAFKFLQQQGILYEYHWAQKADEVLDCLLAKGPVLIGTDWYDSMMDTDKDGFLNVQPNADPEGHCTCLIGAHRAKQRGKTTVAAVEGINSWTDKWGKKGHFWITMDDFAKLLKAKGEAGIGIELQK
jgi:hypothetical protein